MGNYRPIDSYYRIDGISIMEDAGSDGIFITSERTRANKETALELAMWILKTLESSK